MSVLDVILVDMVLIQLDVGITLRVLVDMDCLYIEERMSVLDMVLG